MLHSELAPVELYYLQRLKKANIRDIFAFIFRTLIFNRVLNLKKMFIYPDYLSKRTQKYFKFVKGKNYEHYEAKPYEEKILNPFNRYGKMQAKTITNFVLKKFKVPGDFISKELLQPLKKEGYITSTPFVGKKKTEKAQEALQELNTYMSGIEQMFYSLLDTQVKDEDFVLALLEVNVYLFFIELTNADLFDKIVEKTKEINTRFPKGYENKISPFVEAINVDLSYFEK